MRHAILTLACVTILAPLPSFGQSMEKKWTLQECIDHAMANNITLKKNQMQKLSVKEDVELSKAQLLPSLNASTSQNIIYRPFIASGQSTVANGYVQSSIDKVYYSGSYSVSANWTVWNGNRNTNQVKLNALAENEAELDSITSARSIEERIAQLFVQILYSKEAVKVNQATLEAAKVNEQRGLEMVKVGTMSKADCSQLTAQRAQDEYSVVQSESNVRDFKRQLKALLQLTDDEEFDVVSSTPTDAMALQPIPSLSSVYEAALENRPEIKRAMLDVESADIQMKLAKGQRMPSISLNAAVSTNNSSMSDNNWGDQIKTNFNAGGGVTISVPIFDQRSSRTAINKANIQKQTALLNIKDKQTTLYSTIENYWIQANNNQNQYKSAKVSTESAQTSYDLLSEQFAVGLKNIVELQTGKTRLLSAQQSELQSKYLTILNRQLLEFYKR